ncbi:MAG: hypothetical protein LBM93_04195, partial [Oscillospiraceae bacterium]|nr:hypothetical protein [Oscillospiraceae bacterium]
MNKKYLKLISWVLVFTMLIFDTAGLPVFRKAMVYSASVMSESEVEAEQEAFEDSISIVSAGNWGISRYVDNLSWGFFHYEVQKHIIKKYDPKIKKEQEIIFSKNKKGRADLAEEITDPKSSNYGLTYLWEVKPYSYSVDPKKTKGENQLKGYVGTKDYYRIGNTDGVNIEADSFTVVISEKISYNITYEPAKSGLILYKFKRINVDDNKYPPTAFDYFSTYKKNSLDFSKQEVADEYKNNEQKHIEYDEGWLGKVAIKIILTIATVATAYYTVDNYSSISASVKNLAAKFVANKTPEAAAEFMASISIFIEDDPILKGKIYNELFEEGYTKQEIDNIMEEIQSYSADMDTATSAQPPRDPLAIDLGASGIKLTSLANGVNFDLDNNNFAEKTAWIGNEDGFLALDRNGDGIINNGGELFGDRVLMSDGEISKSGFEALADLNINDDNVIDNNDEVFDNLIVWFDENQDGISQNEELKSLEEMNIISISLNVTKESNIDTETGTMEAEYAMVTFSNGNQSRISEFWFPVNSADTTQNGIKTSGNIPSIAQAIESDETGILDELCACFARAEDIKIKRYYLKQILYFISGAIDLEPGSRGGNIDARDLKVIEEFMGREFVGVGGANPNSPAAEILKKISTDIENNYYNILNLHAGLGGYLISVYETTDENGTKILETELLDYIIEDKIAAGENVDVLIYDLGVYLKNFDSRNQSSNFEKYKTHYSAISEHYAEIVKLSESANTYIGTDKNDVFNGTNNNDFVFGKSNNDTL